MHLRFFQRLRSGPLFPFFAVAIGGPALIALSTSIGQEKLAERKKEFEAKYKMPESLVKNNRGEE